ncbi:MAG: hypothetical protein RLZZ51_409 [Actinomycetota bacterium]
MPFDPEERFQQVGELTASRPARTDLQLAMRCIDTPLGPVVVKVLPSLRLGLGRHNPRR